MPETTTLLLTRDDIDRILQRMAHEIIEKSRKEEAPALVGIRIRGDALAERLRRLLENLYGTSLDIGALDIGLYRDDVERGNGIPELRSTDIDFDVDERHIILVDDVFYTGRTVRAALNAMFDLGRPRRVELVVLVDRGHRELPIRPDYVGRKIKTRSDEKIEVKLSEVDGEDAVYLAH
jgi:pyrimidine operon attenuation protein/uracil phosphoribosyltransferase